MAGEKLEDAIEVIRELNDRGIGGILDLLGEGVTDPAGAAAAAAEYSESIKRIEQSALDTTVSVKLTQLGLAFDKSTCVDHMRGLATEAAAIGTVLEIDMEQSVYVDETIQTFQLLREDFPGLRLAIQAYLRRTPLDLGKLADIPPKIRLVKGAYSEPYRIAFQNQRNIVDQYRFLIDWLFENGRDPGIATHDQRLIDYAVGASERAGKNIGDFEIQMLYGVRRDLQERLAAQGHRVRVYVPFGSAWYPYLMRRIAERPANIRFFLRAMLGD